VCGAYQQNLIDRNKQGGCEKRSQCFIPGPYAYQNPNQQDDYQYGGVEDGLGHPTAKF
jgi:hypothetical protein